MLLTEKEIQALKQTNISSHPDKTKERVQTLWKAANLEQKQKLCSLAGIGTGTIYRVCNIGTLSAKLAIAIAQTFNVNPYYLLGEAEENGEYAKENVNQLLEQYGYKKTALNESPEPPKEKRTYTKRLTAPTGSFAAPDVKEEPPSIEILSEEILQALLHAMIIRANATKTTEKLERVQKILLS